MKIYSMTATFGKLEHETLTLEPGLNIIEAPNEWGKSTWCAFLISMLYGIDTRSRTTKDALADKEHYAPWSGSPMSGRIELNWNGRDITIERSSKGRVPMGVFRAYETETGLNVPELTAANCGQALLGVERSVFTRSAFLRFSDLPVTNDEALRHRLNSLVTTGDESGAAEALGQKLRDLKNKCRHNKTGLLPQAEDRRDQIKARLTEQEDLAQQSARIQRRQEELQAWITQLENHKTALTYAAAQNDVQRIQAAAAARDEAARQKEVLDAQCQAQPTLQQALQAISELNRLQNSWDSLQMEEQMLPEAPVAPEPPAIFRGLTPEEAVVQATEDSEDFEALTPPKKANPSLLFAAAGLMGIAGLVLLVLKQILFAIPLLCIGAIALTVGLVIQKNYRTALDQFHNQQAVFQHRYGNVPPKQWLATAEGYRRAWLSYGNQQSDYRQLRGDLDNRRKALMEDLSKVSQGRSLRDSLNHWTKITALWNDAADAARTLQQAEHHLQTLQAMAKPAEAPQMPDELTFTEDETNNLLSKVTFEHRQLHMQLGHCQGQMGTLGSGDTLQRELDALEQRIEKLELTYAALDYAQNALAAASAELQRRFAPRISKRSQELFSQLTGGRYDRLTLTEELSLQASAQGEDTLRSQQWRSDGTADQLYLALRLAVAQELTPDAPLILDDALVRFDDIRLREALKILQQESQKKQVILFTCQSREKELL